ncbi:MAG: hypothetical protein ACFFCM_22965 [Promethearchaeota archaeon]
MAHNIHQGFYYPFRFKDRYEHNENVKKMRRAIEKARILKIQSEKGYDN